MGSNNIIVREYLESLKEDQELDYLFPILLDIMGFRIVATPKESKGQPQYGKDIVAIGKDGDITKRFYFELKGHSDKDINDTVLNKPDGIMDSLKASKYTPFEDSSIPGFNSLPIKYVLVHNGLLSSNTRRTFQGFIDDLFEEGEFERWDINWLMENFSQHLFSEYLFTDETNLRLFKKTLVLLDSPENDFSDFKQLVNIQIETIGPISKGRFFKKFFATQNLLASVVFHYAKENDNLEAAKECLTFLVLKTWAWILRNKFENRPTVKAEFRKLLTIHHQMLDDYFEKTLTSAKRPDGLYTRIGGPFEEIGYPLRSMEYLGYLIFHMHTRQYFPKFNGKVNERKRLALRRRQKDLLIELVNNNEDGCCRPLLDNHSIPITMLSLFFLEIKDLSKNDLTFYADFLFKVMNSIMIGHTLKGRFPILGNELQLIKNLKQKSEDDPKSLPPSLLLTMLFEFAGITSFKEFHSSFKTGVEGKANLQTAHPNVKDFDIEQLMFERNIDGEFYVETNIPLEVNIEDFRSSIKARQFDKIDYRTDKAGFPQLKYLAHLYYKNELFPAEWRPLYDVGSIVIS